jgi:hypothetical protein
MDRLKMDMPECGDSDTTCQRINNSTSQPNYSHRNGFLLPISIYRFMFIQNASTM